MNEDSDTIYGYPRMESVCKGGNSHLLNFASAYAKGCELEEETRILKKEIDELKQENERLENLTASGIHTCHSECQRPMCVLRRERDKLAAELMKVTAERDEAKKDWQYASMERANWQSNHRLVRGKLRQVEQRNAELVAANRELGDAIYGTASVLRERASKLEVVHKDIVVARAKQ